MAHLHEEKDISYMIKTLKDTRLSLKMSLTNIG